MSDHMNQMTPAAALLGREVIEADKVTGEVRVRLDISFLKPARPGPLTAVARVVERDPRSAKVEAEISDDSGAVLATARAELRILPRVR